MTLLVVIHVLVCFFLIAVVLLQHGRGADIGASFGGSSQTLFGSEGPVPLLNKITTIAAICFMLTSVSLAYISSHSGKGSVMRKVQPAKAEQPVDGVPAPSPAPEQAYPAEPEPVVIPVPPARGDATESEKVFPSFPEEKLDGQEKDQNQEPTVPVPPTGGN